MDLPNIFNKTLKEMLVIFITTLLILFGYPLLLIILIPCWIYKQCALKLARKDTKIQRVLEGLDGALASQDPYSDPLMVLMPYFSLADKLDVPTVVKVLKEKVIAPNYYPELTQRIVRKFGYHFWYSTDNFKVENHVRYLKPECPNMPITRTELKHILTRKTVKLPFDCTKSPWEILVVPNMVDDKDPEVKSVFILRVNHCLMDGYSIAYFLKKVGLFKPWKFLSGETLEKSKKDTPKSVDISKILMLLFLGPYHFLKMFVFSSYNHQYVKNDSCLDSEVVFNEQCTPTIPDTRLKYVRNAYGVTTSSVILTLFSQATWKCMTKSGMDIPDTIHGCMIVPLPGHGDTLTNHCSFVNIPIKVNETDATKTLQFVEKEFQGLRNSVKPLVAFYVINLIASIPLGIRPKTNFCPASFLLTNFPGPTEPTDFFGCMATTFEFVGTMKPETPFVHVTLSLAGKFWFQVNGTPCNLPNQRDADAFCESLIDTLAELELKIM